MKNIKKAVIAVVGAVPLMLPLGAVAHAQVAQDIVPLLCHYHGSAEEVVGNCDLKVDKLVSINGGAFVEADTSADAAQATVGDTVTWKIIVTNTSSDNFTPYGWVHVRDVLPSGVSYVSSSADQGTYFLSGSFPNEWVIPLANSDGFTNLPATLTITSTSTATGLYENTAFFSGYEYPNGPDGAHPYADDNNLNDSNDAWIDPSAKPVVLAESTLVNTGSGTALQTIAAGTLIAATAATLLAGRRRGYKSER